MGYVGGEERVISDCLGWYGVHKRWEEGKERREKEKGKEESLLITLYPLIDRYLSCSSLKVTINSTGESYLSDMQERVEISEHPLISDKAIKEFSRQPMFQLWDMT